MNSGLDINQAIELGKVDNKTISKLALLLERSGIDLDDISKVNKVKAYQGFYKDAEGAAHTVDMHGIELVPSWSEGPAWPVAHQAKPVVAKPRPAPQKVSATQVIVIAPDPQIGFRRYENGTLDPFHDERAIELHLQIIRDARPDKIINLGDTLDLPEWSDRWAIHPEMVLTTQPTIDRGHRHIAEQLTEAPTNCEMYLLEGNHDARLGKLILKNAMAALRLRQANTPESWPVLSIQHLLRMDEFGKTPQGSDRVTYVDGYPAGRLRLANGSDRVTPLFAIHGEKTSVSAVAKTERQSFVQGHIHHIADYWQSYELEDSIVNVNAWSCGCLCRIDGAVPSVKGGTRSNGRPVNRVEQWQQGMAVVTVTEDGTWNKEIIPMFNGTAIWRGKEYRA